MAASVERRLLFGSVAESYDRYRPSYPAQLIDDVLAYAGVTPGERALEVGAGTGIATRLFAARGLSITAVEPDAAMAAVASQRAATDGTTVEVRNVDFEHAQLEPHTFRLLYSGTAWHWVTPELRYQLAGQALAPGGALAAFWNRPVWDDNPVRPGFEAAYAGVAEEFARIGPGPMHPETDADVLKEYDWCEELAGAEEFEDAQTQPYRWVIEYPRDAYIGLLGTHSDHLLLPVADRERLFAAIGAAIDALGGSFQLTYEALLGLARRR